MKVEWLEAAAQSDAEECIEWPWGLNHGYGQIRLRGEMRQTHPIVCEMRYGPRPDGMLATHACGNKRCQNGSHLRWATGSQNWDDAREHGVAPIGSRHGMAKLDEETVRRIRSLRQHGALQRELASMFGVTRNTISNIVNRKTWRHV